MIVNAYSYTNYYKNINNQQNFRKIKNTYTDKVSFGGNNLTKARRTELTKQLTYKMQNRPKSVQKLYEYAIDFVNNKLTKDEFIQNMYELLNEGFDGLNDNEARHVCNYGIAFDMNGNNPKKFTYKSITDSFDSLLYDI